MRYLRNNTAVIVTVGPFLDATNGVAEETGLTVTNCHLVMYKDDDDGTAVNSIIDTTCTASGGDNDLVHIAHGMYSLELTAAQTNYYGRVLLQISDSTNHCPVFHEFVILPQQVYDSLILGTDLLQIDVEAIDNDAPAAANLNSACDNYSATRGLAGTALPAAAADAAGGLIISDAGGLDADGLYAGVVTNAAGTDIAADIIALKAETASILEDTGTTIPATLTGMSGATFDTSTDSLEAIRNRGDAAWTSGSAQPIPYAPTSIAYTLGNDESPGGEDYTDLAAHDDVYVQCGESAADGLAFDVLATLSGKQTENPTLVRISAFYNGAVGHELAIQTYNYVSAAYESVATMKSRTTPFDYVVPLDPDNHDPANGSMKIRFLHNAATYNATHYLRVDYVSFEKRTVTDALAADVASILATVNDLDLEVDSLVNDGVKLGDVAHGGTSATITVNPTGGANQLPTYNQLESKTLPIRQFLAKDFYECGSWDGSDADVLAVTFDGVLDANGYIYLVAWPTYAGGTAPTTLGGIEGAGAWAKAGGWTTSLGGHSLGLQLDGVTTAGTLTITVKAGASYLGPATAHVITVDIPLVAVGAGNEFFPTNTGELLMYGTVGAVTTAVDAATIAAAVTADMDANSTKLADIVEDTGTTLPSQIAGIPAGSGLTAQQTRDAMKLAPTAGAPAAGSVDAHLDATALEATLLAVRAVGGLQPSAVVEGSKITVVRGDTGTISFPLLSSEWDLLDPAGQVAHFTVKRRATDTDAILEATATIAGAQSVTYTPAATDFPDAGRYSYDLEITATDGSNPQTAIIGTLIVLQDVRQ